MIKEFKCPRCKVAMKAVGIESDTVPPEGGARFRMIRVLIPRHGRSRDCPASRQIHKLALNATEGSQVVSVDRTPEIVLAREK